MLSIATCGPRWLSLLVPNSVCRDFEPRLPFNLLGADDALSPQHPHRTRCSAEPRPAGSFRFRYSIRLAPGIRLNIGKRGLTTSLGGRAHITAGRKTRTTVSAPGTGLSYTVIWGARLLGAAVMMALLFLWTAGWL